MSRDADAIERNGRDAGRADAMPAMGGGMIPQMGGGGAGLGGLMPTAALQSLLPQESGGVTRAQCGQTGAGVAQLGADRPAGAVAGAISARRAFLVGRRPTGATSTTCWTFPGVADPQARERWITGPPRGSSSSFNPFGHQPRRSECDILDGQCRGHDANRASRGGCRPSRRPSRRFIRRARRPTSMTRSPICAPPAITCCSTRNISRGRRVGSRRIAQFNPVRLQRVLR